MSHRRSGPVPFVHERALSADGVMNNVKVAATKIKTHRSHSEERETDTLLVQRALAGDADAFATLFQIHKGRVYAVCLRMTNNPADADDLTQEAFIQAFRKLASFRGESALSTWLHRVAVNTALMHFRRHVGSHTSLDEPVDGESGKREFGQHDHRHPKRVWQFQMAAAARNHRIHPPWFSDPRFRTWRKRPFKGDISWSLEHWS